MAYKAAQRGIVVSFINTIFLFPQLKRTASILLLLMLAFNWVGYRFFSIYFENRADVALERQIDKAEYDHTSLVEIRVPLNAPYLSGASTEFERFYGELKLEGIHYKYVMRKIENGDLVLLCLPNEEKNRFENSRTDFFKLVNNLNHTSQSKENNNAPSFKIFVTEYREENNCWTVSAISFPFHSFSVSDNAYCAAGFHVIPDQPPRIA